MNSQTNPDSTLLAVPKLHDDGSNWSDYYPRIQNAMGAKGLWRHVLGTATAPVPYVISKGIPMLSDGKTPATEDQIEAKESKIIEFEKREYLSRHILLSTTSTRLGAKIKDLSTAEGMWKVIVDDATTKSTLYLLDAEDQLSSMKLADDDDPKTHLSELKHHFEIMHHRRENLIKIGSTMSEQRFNIIIMSSLPESYRPTLQTITASERMSRLSGTQSTTMKSDDLIAFIIEEAHHRVINDERNKNAESALAARSKGTGKSNRKEKGESKPDVICDNCKKPGHTGEQCYSKGGGCEGQGPKQKAKAKAKAKESETAVVATNDEEGDLFAFTCTSDYVALADQLEVLKSRLGTCIDSGASRDYCPDRSKFSNYKAIQRRITTADGRTLKAIGSGDLHLELPNGSGKTKIVFKNAIHAPDIASTLISISRLDEAGYAITFNKRVCTIKSPSGKTIAIIPHVDGMYKIAATVSTDIDNTSRQTKPKFQQKKRELVSSYKKDKAYTKTWSGNRLKPSRSDRGGEFLRSKPVNHQGLKGPKKKSVTVDHNVVFDPDDTDSSKAPAIVLGEAQSEGERDKTIQASQKNVDVKEIDKEPETEQTRRQSKPENGVETHRTPEPTINIPTFEANPELELPTPDDDSSFNPEYGQEKRARRPKRGHPRGIAHTEIANQETAVADIDSAFREPINLANHDLHVKQAAGIWDQKPIRVQPSKQQPGDRIHFSKGSQTRRRTSAGFLTFKNVQTAGETLETLNGTQAPDGDTLVLSYARPRRNKPFGSSGNAYRQHSYEFFNQIRRKYRYRRKILIENLTNHRQTGIEMMGERNNQDPIALAKDKSFHATTKHSDLRYHFIKEAVEGRSKLSTYQSSRTIADIFSKSLARSRHQELVAKLGSWHREGKGVGEQTQD